MKKYLIFIFIFFSAQTLAQGNFTVVAVGEAELQKEKIGFILENNSGLSSSQRIKLNELVSVLQSDFNFYKHLFEVSTSKTIDLKSKDHHVIVKLEPKISGGAVELETTVLKLKENKTILEEKFKVNFSNIRSFSHEISDTIYRSLTGKKSIFKSKIIFTSDRGSKGRNIKKEMYIMDFDGERKQKLTNFNSLVISPSISQSNDKILFSLIENRKKRRSDGNGFQNVKNINLHLYDLNTRKNKVISSEPGINSGAVFNHSGDSIYLTLTRQKNADIYKMDLKTGNKSKITKHFAEDVDPHINSDESLMTFLSGRAGKAMIYTLDPSGLEKSVKRISYVGRFNAAPRFNPEGSEIVFSSWVDNRFDIYRINSDGRNLVRLTKNFGSNEEPWYSPDGQFIVFTSQRVITRKRAVQDVYIMNRDGEVIKRVTQNFGKIYTPRWSN